VTGFLVLVLAVIVATALLVSSITAGLLHVLFEAVRMLWGRG
jgi:hypothetical protein